MHNLKHSDNSNIIDYIQTFGTMWSDLQNRLSYSSEKIAANAKALYDMDEYKTIVFLASLSPSMNDIVDNLQTLPNVTYADVISKLQSLRSSNQDTAKALSSLQRRNGKSQKGSSSKRSVKPNPTGPGKTPPPNKNECSWCKKHGRPFTGHTHSNCQALKTWKATGQGVANIASPSTSTSLALIPHPRSHLQPEEHGVAFISGSINSPVFLGDGSALLSGDMNDIWQVWILDTGASHHITADISCLSNLVSRVVDIEVGGG